MIVSFSALKGEIQVLFRIEKKTALLPLINTLQKSEHVLVSLRKPRFPPSPTKRSSLSGPTIPEISYEPFRCLHLHRPISLSISSRLERRLS